MTKIKSKNKVKITPSLKLFLCVIDVAIVLNADAIFILIGRIVFTRIAHHDIHNTVTLMRLSIGALYNNHSLQTVLLMVPQKYKIEQLF